MEARGQHAGISWLFPSCGSQNSDYVVQLSGPFKKKLLNFYVFYYYCTYVSMLWHSVYGHGLHGVHVGVRGQLCWVGSFPLWVMRAELRSPSLHVVNAFTHWAVSPAQICHIFCLSSVCWWAFPFPPPFWPSWTMPLWMFVYSFVVLRFEPRVTLYHKPTSSATSPKMYTLLCDRVCSTLSKWVIA